METLLLNQFSGGPRLCSHHSEQQNHHPSSQKQQRSSSLSTELSAKEGRSHQAQMSSVRTRRQRKVKLHQLCHECHEGPDDQQNVGLCC